MSHEITIYCTLVYLNVLGLNPSSVKNSEIVLGANEDTNRLNLIVRFYFSINYTLGSI